MIDQLAIYQASWKTQLVSNGICFAGSDVFIPMIDDEDLEFWACS